MQKVGKVKATLIGACIAGLGMAGLGIAGTPAAAAADSPAAPDPTIGATSATTGEVVTPGDQQSLAAGGYFYVYEHPYQEGRGCAFEGLHYDYRDAGFCGNLNDIVSSVFNGGVPHEFDDVDMHRDIQLFGPKMCLSRGDYWMDLTLGWERFSNGEYADNKISSHIWVRSCF